MSIVTMTEETRKGINLIGFEPNRLIGWFSLILGAVIALDSTPTFFAQLIAAFIPAELTNIATALPLMGVGAAVLVRPPQSLWLAAQPLFFFLMTNAVAVFKLPVPKGSGILSLAAFFMLISVCDYYMINQNKTEALAHKDDEIAGLKARIAELEAKVISGQ